MRARSCLFPIIAASLCLAACSPSMNWREVHADGTRLQALMPCKPEEAVRVVPLDGRSVRMHLSGCDAGGATFVFGWATVPGPAVGAALGAWQDSILARAGIPGGPDGPVGRAFVPAGALALPQAVRLHARGRGPDGSALLLDAAWFAAPGTSGEIGAQAMFAAVYRQPDAPEAADTFFSGLRLR